MLMPLCRPRRADKGDLCLIKHHPRAIRETNLSAAKSWHLENIISISFEDLLSFHETDQGACCITRIFLDEREPGKVNSSQYC